MSNTKQLFQDAYNKHCSNELIKMFWNHVDQTLDLNQTIYPNDTEAINEIGIRENGMKILFCGTMVPETIEYQIKNISAAGNRFQNNMINNLKSLGHKVDTVSYIAVNIPKALRDELLEEEFCDSNGVGACVLQLHKEHLSQDTQEVA